MDVLSLMATIGIDTSSYDKGLSNASSKLSSFGGAIKSGFGTMVKVGTAAMATIGGAVVGGSAAFIKGAGDVAAYGDNIDKMSQKMGISAQGYQEWEAVMQHSGTSMETLKAGMKTLANAVEKGNGAFKRLGITQEDIAKMDQEDLFNATIAALQNVDDETERTYLAGQLLGRGATELGALLNTSAEDTQAMKDRVYELGGVMSDDAVKAAAAYQDQLQDMQTAFGGLKRGMMSDFMPTITQVMSGLTDLFSGDSSGVGKINSGITDFVNKMSESLPQVLNTGAQIVSSLLTAITNNLPQLVNAGIEAIKILGNGIIENAPQIAESVLQITDQLGAAFLDLMKKATEKIKEFDWVQASKDLIKFLSEAITGEGAQEFIQTASDLITSLVDGISQALPELLPGAMDIVAQLASDLADQIPSLLDSAVDLVIGLAEGLTNPDGLSHLIDSAIKIIEKLVEGIINALPKLTEAAPKIIQNLVNAIVDNLPKLLEAALKIVVQLELGIIRNLPLIVKGAIEIVFSLINGIVKYYKNIFNTGVNLVKELWNGIKKLNPIQWGKDLISNFVQGIKNGWGELKGGLGELGNKIADYIGFSEPKEGPLSNFHTYAPDMMKLFSEGIKENEDLVTNQLAKSFDFSDVIADQNVSMSGSGGNSINGGVVINVYGAEGQNINELADEISYRLQHLYDVAGAVYA